MGMHDMSYLMTPKLWEKIDYFIPDDFGCVDMDGILIYTLQEMRKFIGKPIHIHCGYKDRAGYHGKKCAADLHIDDLHPIDQFVVASRFDNFNGIGVYRWGIHVDTRPKMYKYSYDSRWGCLTKGEYVKLDSNFFRELLE